MAEIDNREPIEPRHTAFAQAVEALARQHDMRSVNVEFYGGGPEERWTKICASWSRGRHGAPSSICLRAEATQISDEVAVDG